MDDTTNASSKVSKSDGIESLTSKLESLKLKGSELLQMYSDSDISDYKYDDKEIDQEQNEELENNPEMVKRLEELNKYEIAPPGI